MVDEEDAVKRCNINSHTIGFRCILHFDNIYMNDFDSSFFQDNAPEKERKDFLDEINLMKRLPVHRNVTSLVGCITKSGEQCYSHKA